MNEQPTPDQMQQAELMKKMALRKILSKPAMERLSRIKLVKPDVANQLEAYLLNLYQSGKITTEVSEEQVKMILETIAGTKQFKIVRK